MTHLLASHLRFTGMHRQSAQTRPIYRVTNCLREGRTVEVPGNQVATTVSAWLAELGASSPLVEDLARAVDADDWPAARALGEYLSVDVALAA
jgi:hypothetical protein